MLHLRAKPTSLLPVEADGMTPDALRGLSVAEIARRVALVGNQSVAWGDLFAIDGCADDGKIVVSGNLSRFKWIGRGISSGRLAIEGPVGTHTASDMRGGEVIIRGDAGDWLGAEMRGGSIRVEGSAGDNVGSAYRGGTKGMRGGSIYVAGNVGSETGRAMRRGLIGIGGSCGEFAGSAMIAGTIVIGGTCGNHPGAGMKRGTLAVLSGRVTVPRSFSFDCVYDPPIWATMMNHLRANGFPLEPGMEHRFVRRYRGDLVSLGLGELLIPVEG